MANKIKVKEDRPSQQQGKEKNQPAAEMPIEEGEIFNPEGELVVDVYETNADFVILAAAAGVLIKDIDISVDKALLVIKGNRQNPKINEAEKYFYQECYWGPFSRKIVLPENIDIEKAAAQMDKGLLTIKIPKIKEGDKEKIGVKTS